VCGDYLKALRIYLMCLNDGAFFPTRYFADAFRSTSRSLYGGRLFYVRFTCVRTPRKLKMSLQGTSIILRFKYG